jgi:hypothetical protein
MNRQELILDYLNKVRQSNKELTKKEAFKDLLNRLYSHDADICALIDKMSLGAETTIFNIPRGDEQTYGSADTLYNRVIIEFENDLQRSYQHAQSQLAGYLLGRFHSGEGYNYTLIVSDFIQWRVLSPSLDALLNINNLNEENFALEEIVSASFTLTEENLDDFYFWIDRFLFREERERATLIRIEEAFGHQSHIFIESFRLLKKAYAEAKKSGQVKVSFEQWHRFLSIAYGDFEADEDVFIIHSYLSIFAKVIAYQVLSGELFITEDKIPRILNGEIFHEKNIDNFIEHDFYHWVSEIRTLHLIRPVFRIIAQELTHFDLSSPDEDILKGVYQELIDLDTRHALGEYYTPDWLCERILQEYQIKPCEKILDPSCGSGSFLRAAFRRIKTLHPELSDFEINQQIYGIDIHPLSVQIAKATLLLAMGQAAHYSSKPVHLNIILANTLLIPEGSEELFGTEFTLHIDQQRVSVNTLILDNIANYDAALQKCDDIAEATRGREDFEYEKFAAMLNGLKELNGNSRKAIESYYRIYKALKSVKERNRDSIWKFILVNLYKPYFLAGYFDYVIGNPPWFTYSSIKNREYQKILGRLAEETQVKPEKSANFPNLEIAAIFQAYCAGYFLKNNGHTAFVLPRAFISGDQHDNSRNGKAKGFNIEKIWDLEKVQPLFNIPSVVFFGRHTEAQKAQVQALDGLRFKGKLPIHNGNWALAAKHLSEEKIAWHYIKQGHSTAFANEKRADAIEINPYKNEFVQGATIIPRAFFFVHANYEPHEIKKHIVAIRTHESARKNAKRPWDKTVLYGRTEGKDLFFTALAKSVMPFALYRPSLVVLPIHIESDAHNMRTIEVLSGDGLMYRGDLYAMKWFHQAERLWNQYRTAANKSTELSDYLNWMQKLSKQNLNREYIVLYTASAKDANAVVVKRSDYVLDFIVESATYSFYTDNQKEAFYLVSILNSGPTNKLIKDFQSKGAFGPRHVSKKILDIWFPRFNAKSARHRRIAELGELCQEKAGAWLQQNPQENLDPYHLGRVRLQLKDEIKSEMEQIDALVEAILTER